MRMISSNFLLLLLENEIEDPVHGSDHNFRFRCWKLHLEPLHVECLGLELLRWG